MNGDAFERTRHKAMDLIGDARLIGYDVDDVIEVLRVLLDDLDTRGDVLIALGLDGDA